MSPIHGFLEVWASEKKLRTTPLPIITGPICQLCEQPVSFYVRSSATQSCCKDCKDRVTTKLHRVNQRYPILVNEDRRNARTLICLCARQSIAIPVKTKDYFEDLLISLKQSLSFNRIGHWLNRHFY